MAEKFPFSMHDAEHVLCSTDHIVPGMRRVVYVYYSAIHRQIRSVEALPPYGDPKDLRSFFLDEKDLPLIKKMREEKNDFLWYAEKELTFLCGNENAATDDIPKIEAAKHKKNIPSLKKETGQCSTDEESLRHILMITIRNEHDNNNDLFFYFYNDNLSNYHLSNSSDALVHYDKLVIGLKMFNMINLLVETSRNYRSMLKNTITDLKNKNEALKKSLTESEQQNEHYHKSVVDYALEILHKLSSDSQQYVFELSESAVSKFRGFKGNLNDLQKKLKEITANKALQNIDLHPENDFEAALTWEFEIEKSKQTISIEASDLNFEQLVAPVKEQAVISNGLITSTYKLYDKFEEACEKVKLEGLPLTAYNVGQKCLRKMSPPAISFALRAHKKWLNRVLDDNKDKWPIIRKEFKPLINILIQIETENAQKIKQA
ncbi:MAG TPA: hypothetical protein PLT47_07685 [Bacteroidales bacterium]|nr:hypothetical protein [Bacteroidales bacterium]HQI70616.1 hypothetical protein [Bacteroidales bacterium]